MSDLIYESDYAQKMLCAAMRCQAGDTREAGSEPESVDDVTALIEQALEAGCSSTELMLELAHLMARVLAASAPDIPPVRETEDPPLPR